MRHEAQNMIPRYQEKSYRHPGILNPSRFAQNFELRCYEPSPDMAEFVELYFVSRRRPDSDPAFRPMDVLTRPVVNLFLTAAGANIHGVTRGRRILDVAHLPVYAGVKFRPGGFYPFWRKPLIELAEQPLEAVTIFSELQPAPVQKLLARPHDSEVVFGIEKILRAHRPKPNKHISVIDEILQRIELGELQTVTALASEFHLSERTLQRLFRVHAGVGLKWCLMRTRFLESARRAHDTGRSSWTMVAAELGYSSQSHFANDFKRYAGLAPSRYAQSTQEQ